MLINNPKTQFQAVGKLFLIAFSFLIMTWLFIGPSVGVAQATQNKVKVCHVTDNGSYNVIEVAEAALNAHLGHGDLVVGVDVDENCEPLVTDSDDDGVADDLDNCVDVANPGQEDTYGSGAGDACEDTDGDGTPDTAEANFCLSIDGVLLISQGTAVCQSTPTIGVGPNVALANGHNATAYAGTNGSFDLLGSNIRASAIGDYAFVTAGGWDVYGIDGANLTVTAHGFGAYATAAPSRNTISTATGEGASSQANYCDGCSSTAIGNYANTAAGNGTNNHSSATGDNAYAWARLGSNNTATAEGAGAVAYAQWGSDNTATSTGVYTCAGGSSGATIQNGEVAVNEDKCN